MKPPGNIDKSQKICEHGSFDWHGEWQPIKKTDFSAVSQFAGAGAE